MIYQDLKVAIPSSRAYKVGTYIYYRVRSYMTDNGKERHEQHCIGKRFVDEKGNEWLLPNDRYFQIFNLHLPTLDQKAARQGRVKDASKSVKQRSSEKKQALPIF